MFKMTNYQRILQGGFNIFQCLVSGVNFTEFVLFQFYSTSVLKVTCRCLRPYKQFFSAKFYIIASE